MSMEHQHRLAFGAFQLDLRDERLWRGGAVIRLTPKAFAVLQCLLAHSGQLVTKEILLATVWPEAVVSDGVLAAAIRELRRVLGDSARSPHYIETVHGRGYRFIAVVEPLPQDAAESSASTIQSVDDTFRGCPACQSINALDASFCNACGSPLDDAPPHAVASATLASAMPADQDHVLASDSTFLQVAERRQLTVMFCDLVGSTPMAEMLDPEALREVIHNYQAACADVIEPFQGHIAQYLGDGLLIYFGYPQAHEDDAQRAVRAGLGILAAIASLSDHLEQTHGIRLAMRIGIHTGLVVVGGVDYRGRQEQLALGVTPNIAARLQDLASPNTLVVSAATYQLVQGYFVVEDLGEHALLGLSTPIKLLRVLRESEAQNRLEAASRHSLTAFVGRDLEIALLRERWGSVVSGRGQVVVVSGEAGIGKSRLIQVFKDAMIRDNYTPIECRSSPYAQHSPLYPVTDLIARRLKWDTQDDPETKLTKLESMLAQFRPPMNETVPLFASLLSFSPPEDRYAPLMLTPDRLRQKLFEAFILNVLEASERQPVLFILEDLHWSDPSTLELLDLLMAQVPAKSIMMLLTYRPEFTLPWGIGSHMTPIALHRLPRDQIELMMDRVTGGKVLPAELVEQLIDKTDGVPLFIEEMTKAVLESDYLHERNGHYWLRDSAAEVTIPTSLQDSLMARLDRLITAKGIAQMGAAIGRQFSYSLLQAIVQQDDAVLQQELRQLVEAEILYQSGLPPQATYLFKHALIQDTAYKSLLNATRQEVHRQITQVLETQFPETAETQPELLAHHALQGEVWSKALEFYRHAGTKALSQSAYSEAVVYGEQALLALRQLPVRRDMQEQSIDIRLNMRNALIALGEFGVMFDHLCAAESLAETLGDQRRLGWVSAYLSPYFLNTGDQDRAIETGQRALTIAATTEDFDLEVMATFFLGMPYISLGIYRQASHYHRRNVALLTSEWCHKRFGEPGLPAVFTRIWLAWSLAELGAFEEASGRVSEAMQLAETVDQPFSLGHAYWGMGFISLRRGDLEQAGAMLEQGLDICRNGKVHLLLPWVTTALGATYTLLGRFSEGIPLLEQALEQDGSRMYTPLLMAYLGEGYLRATRIEEARELAKRALPLAPAI